jgi:hypothetical protein
MKNFLFEKEVFSLKERGYLVDYRGMRLMKFCYSTRSRPFDHLPCVAGFGKAAPDYCQPDTTTTSAVFIRRPSPPFTHRTRRPCRNAESWRAASSASSLPWPECFRMAEKAEIARMRFSSPFPGIYHTRLPSCLGSSYPCDPALPPTTAAPIPAEQLEQARREEV